MVSVTKIAAMLEKATENTPAEPPRAACGLTPARFARDPGEYRTSASRPKPDWMTVIDGGAHRHFHSGGGVVVTKTVVSDPISTDLRTPDMGPVSGR